MPDQPRLTDAAIAAIERAGDPVNVAARTDRYPIIMNGDHAEFEQEWAGKDPKDRPDWPMPSFDAREWAAAFCKIANEDLGYRDPEGNGIDEGWMITWFAAALMRGYDEHVARAKYDDPR